MDTIQRKRELKRLIIEKKEQIENAKKESNKFNSMQLALKLILNGSYGAFANKHFVCFCNGVASTITAHGRDLIKIMDKAGNHYFKKKWHLDTELHKELGVTNVKPIPADTECCVYVDTDSNFFSLKPVMDSCGWDSDDYMENLKFVHIVSKRSLSVWFKEVLNKYAEKYKVKNVQDFELEQVSKSIIFLEKKMYVKNVIWEDGSPNDSNPEWQKNGMFMLPESSLQAKGIDIIRSTSPVFAREKTKEIIKYFFQNPSTYNDRELVKIVRRLKEEFKMTAASKIEDVSNSSSCSNYDKYILDDQVQFTVMSGTPHAVKAAALHNFLLNNNSKYKSKYNLIKGGSKIKYYKTTNTINNEFGYIQGMYPREIGEIQAPIDIDAQFDACMLSLINRFNKVLGLSELNSNLTYTLSLI